MAANSCRTSLPATSVCENALKWFPWKSWKLAWVRYWESPVTAPIVSSISPVIGDFDPSPLKSAIAGLHAEAFKHLQKMDGSTPFGASGRQFEIRSITIQPGSALVEGLWMMMSKSASMY